ncbi:MAG TPA: membrane protein insertion efficiency factor YidD [Candidatus Kaiserbacteria bacterium]|nr:membrane protein insertion efficiency factor YidD [Candidatus Kaiserbacteria bacterium]
MFLKKYKKLTIQQTVFIKLLEIYQITISPDHGVLNRIGLKKTQTCVFYPTCSEYTKQAIEHYGVSKGLYKGAGRIWRCRPKEINHIDPIV